MDVLRNFNKILKDKIELKDKEIFELKIKLNEYKKSMEEIKTDAENQIKKFTIENIVDDNNINFHSKDINIYEQFLYVKIRDNDIKALRTLHNENFPVFKKYFSRKENMRGIFNLGREIAKSLFLSYESIEDFFLLIELFIENEDFMRVHFDFLICLSLYSLNKKYVNRTLKLLSYIPLNILKETFYLRELIELGEGVDVKFNFLLKVLRANHEVVKIIGEDIFMQFTTLDHILREELCDLIFDSSFISIQNKKMLITK